MNINELDISAMTEKDQNLFMDRVQLPQGCKATTRKSVNIWPENRSNNSLEIRINIKTTKRGTCLRQNHMSQL